MCLILASLAIEIVIASFVSGQQSFSFESKSENLNFPINPAIAKGFPPGARDISPLRNNNEQLQHNPFSNPLQVPPALNIQPPFSANNPGPFKNRVNSPPFIPASINPTGINNNPPLNQHPFNIHLPNQNPLNINPPNQNPSNFPQLPNPNPFQIHIPNPGPLNMYPPKSNFPNLPQLSNQNPFQIHIPIHSPLDVPLPNQNPSNLPQPPNQNPFQIHIPNPNQNQHPPLDLKSLLDALNALKSPPEPNQNPLNVPPPNRILPNNIPNNIHPLNQNPINMRPPNQNSINLPLPPNQNPFNSIPSNQNTFNSKPSNQKPFNMPQKSNFAQPPVNVLPAFFQNPNVLHSQSNPDKNLEPVNTSPIDFPSGQSNEAPASLNEQSTSQPNNYSQGTESSLSASSTAAQTKKPKKKKHKHKNGTNSPKTNSISTQSSLDYQPPDDVPDENSQFSFPEGFVLDMLSGLDLNNDDNTKEKNIPHSPSKQLSDEVNTSSRIVTESNMSSSLSPFTLTHFFTPSSTSSSIESTQSSKINNDSGSTTKSIISTTKRVTKRPNRRTKNQVKKSLKVKNTETNMQDKFNQYDSNLTKIITTSKATERPGDLKKIRVKKVEKLPIAVVTNEDAQKTTLLETFTPVLKTSTKPKKKNVPKEVAKSKEIPKNLENFSSEFTAAASTASEHTYKKHSKNSQEIALSETTTTVSETSTKPKRKNIPKQMTKIKEITKKFEDVSSEIVPVASPTFESTRNTYFKETEEIPILETFAISNNKEISKKFKDKYFSSEFTTSSQLTNVDTTSSQPTNVDTTSSQPTNVDTTSQPTNDGNSKYTPDITDSETTVAADKKLMTTVKSTENFQSTSVTETTVMPKNKEIAENVEHFSSDFLPVASTAFENIYEARSKNSQEITLSETTPSFLESSTKPKKKKVAKQIKKNINVPNKLEDFNSEYIPAASTASDDTYNAHLENNQEITLSGTTTYVLEKSIKPKKKKIPKHLGDFESEYIPVASTAFRDIRNTYSKNAEQVRLSKKSTPILKMFAIPKIKEIFKNFKDKNFNNEFIPVATTASHATIDRYSKDTPVTTSLETTTISDKGLLTTFSGTENFKTSSVSETNIMPINKDIAENVEHFSSGFMPVASTAFEGIYNGYSKDAEGIPLLAITSNLETTTIPKHTDISKNMNDKYFNYEFKLVATNASQATNDENSRDVPEASVLETITAPSKESLTPVISAEKDHTTFALGTTIKAETENFQTNSFSETTLILKNKEIAENSEHFSNDFVPVVSTAFEDTHKARPKSSQEMTISAATTSVAERSTKQRKKKRIAKKMTKDNVIPEKLQGFSSKYITSPSTAFESPYKAYSENSQEFTLSETSTSALKTSIKPRKKINPKNLEDFESEFIPVASTAFKDIRNAYSKGAEGIPHLETSTPILGTFTIPKFKDISRNFKGNYFSSKFIPVDTTVTKATYDRNSKYTPDITDLETTKASDKKLLTTFSSTEYFKPTSNSETNIMSKDKDIVENINHFNRDFIPVASTTFEEINNTYTKDTEGIYYLETTAPSLATTKVPNNTGIPKNVKDKYINIEFTPVATTESQTIDDGYSKDNPETTASGKEPLTTVISTENFPTTSVLETTVTAETENFQINLFPETTMMPGTEIFQKSSVSETTIMPKNKDIADNAQHFSSDFVPTTSTAFEDTYKAQSKKSQDMTFTETTMSGTETSTKPSKKKKNGKQMKKGKIEDFNSKFIRVALTASEDTYKSHSKTSEDITLSGTTTTVLKTSTKPKKKRKFKQGTKNKVIPKKLEDFSSEFKPTAVTASEDTYKAQFENSQEITLPGTTTSVLKTNIKPKKKKIPKNLEDFESEFIPIDSTAFEGVHNAYSKDAEEIPLLETSTSILETFSMPKNKEILRNFKDKYFSIPFIPVASTASQATIDNYLKDYPVMTSLEKFIASDKDFLTTIGSTGNFKTFSVSETTVMPPENRDIAENVNHFSRDFMPVASVTSKGIYDTYSKDAEGIPHLHTITSILETTTIPKNLDISKNLKDNYFSFEFTPVTTAASQSIIDEYSKDVPETAVLETTTETGKESLTTAISTENFHTTSVSEITMTEETENFQTSSFSETTVIPETEVFQKTSFMETTMMPKNIYIAENIEHFSRDFIPNTSSAFEGVHNAYFKDAEGIPLLETTSLILEPTKIPKYKNISKNLNDKYFNNEFIPIANAATQPINDVNSKDVPETTALETTTTSDKESLITVISTENFETISNSETTMMPKSENFQTISVSEITIFPKYKEIAENLEYFTSDFTSVFTTASQLTNHVNSKDVPETTVLETTTASDKKSLTTVRSTENVQSISVSETTMMPNSKETAENTAHFNSDFMPVSSTAFEGIYNLYSKDAEGIPLSETTTSILEATTIPENTDISENMKDIFLNSEFIPVATTASKQMNDENSKDTPETTVLEATTAVSNKESLTTVMSNENYQTTSVLETKRLLKNKTITENIANFSSDYIPIISAASESAHDAYFKNAQKHPLLATSTSVLMSTTIPENKEIHKSLENKSFSNEFMHVFTTSSETSNGENMNDSREITLLETITAFDEQSPTTMKIIKTFQINSVSETSSMPKKEIPKNADDKNFNTELITDSSAVYTDTNNSNFKDAQDITHIETTATCNEESMTIFISSKNAQTIFVLDSTMEPKHKEISRSLEDKDNNTKFIPDASSSSKDINDTNFKIALKTTSLEINAACSNESLTVSLKTENSPKFFLEITAIPGSKEIPKNLENKDFSSEFMPVTSSSEEINDAYSKDVSESQSNSSTETNSTEIILLNTNMTRKEVIMSLSKCKYEIITTVMGNTADKTSPPGASLEENGSNPSDTSESIISSSPEKDTEESEVKGSTKDKGLSQSTTPANLAQTTKTKSTDQMTTAYNLAKETIPENQAQITTEHNLDQVTTVENVDTIATEATVSDVIMTSTVQQTTQANDAGTSDESTESDENSESKSTMSASTMSDETSSSTQNNPKDDNSTPISDETTESEVMTSTSISTEETTDKSETTKCDETSETESTTSASIPSDESSKESTVEEITKSESSTTDSSTTSEPEMTTSASISAEQTTQKSDDKEVTKETCTGDEIWWDCMPKRHNTCETYARAEAEKDFTCDPGCFCKEGLISTNGKCVDPDDCPDPECPNEDEEKTDCLSPCNTCDAVCNGCSFVMCRSGCDCRDGYKRSSDGTCVHASMCPPCSS